MSGNDIKENGILINAQVGIFFKEMVIKPEIDLWQPISSLFNFDTPTIIPIPIDETLGDTPIVQAILQRKDEKNQVRVAIARKRIDLYVDGYGAQSYQEPLNQLTDVINQILDAIEDKISVNRVGLIARSFYENANANKSLRSLIDKKLVNNHGVKKEAVDVFIRYVTRDNVGDTNINNYTEYQPFVARIVSESGTTNPSGILVVRDINTSPDDDISSLFNSSYLIKFINDVKPLLDFPKFKP